MRITKSLESAMSRALFASANLYKRLSLKDALMVQLLSAEGTLAYNLLVEWMGEDRLGELRHSITGGAFALPCEDNPETFYRNYPLQLSHRFGSEVRLTTMHALIEILSDRRTLSAYLFPKYGITITLLTSWLMHSTDDKEAI